MSRRSRAGLFLFRAFTGAAALVGLLLIAAATPAWSAAASSTTGETVAPPSTMASDCSTDVSGPMQHWLKSLSPGTTVQVPPGACYLVNEGIELTNPQGITISGGTWKDATVPVPGQDPSDMDPVFWFVGGSNVTMENLSIVGVNPGGYDPAGAFAAGLRSDGVTGFTVSDVDVHDVYGDGIQMSPLRADGDVSGTILSPTEDATISDVRVVGAGRQGISLISVNGAVISSVHLADIGMDVFDLEADQSNEGALNVTIDGCTVGGGDGGYFFANAGASGGRAWTGNITVENCTMNTPDIGVAVLVQSPAGVAHPRGPFTFVNDTLLCGPSINVDCVADSGGDISFDGSSLTVPSDSPVRAAVYQVTDESTVGFVGDTVSGYGSRGTVDASSSVSVTGGVWTPYTAPSLEKFASASGEAAVATSTARDSRPKRSAATAVATPRHRHSPRRTALR